MTRRVQKRGEIVSGASMSENLVEVRFKIKKDAEGFPRTRDWEELKCLQEGNTYEIRNVPFYLRDVAYGDHVFVVREPKGYLKFRSVERRGGYSVFQLWLQKKAGNPLYVVKELVDLGLLVEFEGRLIALAVPPERNAEDIYSYIKAGKKSRRWGFQSGFQYEGI
jgi:hypothetical protein